MLKHLYAAILCGLVFFALAPTSVLGQGNGNGHGKGHNKHAQQDDDDDQDADEGAIHGNGHGRHIETSFSAQDRDMIRGYYQGHNGGLPPGLAKRNGNLPPGLQKHLEKNGTLPPGLQKRLQPFPEELEAQLPPVPDNCYRVTLGFDVMILDRRTQRIIDIAHDLLRR